MRRLPKADLVESEPYKLSTLKAPVLRGVLLRFFIWLVKTPLGDNQQLLKNQNTAKQVTREILIPERPTYEPTPSSEPTKHEGDVEIVKTDAGIIVKKVMSFVPNNNQRSHAPSIRDFIEAYTSGRVTPLMVAEKIVSMIERTPNLYWFITFDKEAVLQQGRASTERYRVGHPLSQLDGVPFCAKDGLYAVGYPATCGSASIHDVVDDEHEEAPVIKTLKELGAIFLGKTNMHEIGLGVTGLNLIHGTPANPWNREHYPGGSTSGGCAVVASALCPLSIGSDGGGSIRIPSSFCGVFGLKMTHGREEPQCGAAFDYTVCCSGPIANYVEDAMLLYLLLCKIPAANRDQRTAPVFMPKLVLTAKPLVGIKIGIYKEWFDHCDREVKDCCEAAVEQLKNLGCEIASITIPELEFLRVSHTTTIISEMIQATKRLHGQSESRRKLNPDVQLSLIAGSVFKSDEYIQAQCIRTRMRTHFKRVFDSGVDCIATPTTPITAPRIHPSARNGGEHNLKLTSTIMRYVPAANFIGFPAASIPVGFDSQGLPIGLQVLGKHWSESLLLKICYHLEKEMRKTSVTKPPTSPEIYCNPLEVSNV